MDVGVLGTSCVLVAKSVADQILVSVGAGVSSSGLDSRSLSPSYLLLLLEPKSMLMPSFSLSF